MKDTDGASLRAATVTGAVVSGTGVTSPPTTTVAVAVAMAVGVVVGVAVGVGSGDDEHVTVTGADADLVWPSESIATAL
jgi:hypothetical protein